MKLLKYIFILVFILSSGLFAATNSASAGGSFCLLELTDGTVLKGWMKENGPFLSFTDEAGLGKLEIPKNLIKTMKTLSVGGYFWIKTTEGNRLSGVCTFIDQEQVVLKTEAVGIVRIPISRIIDFGVARIDRFPNPNETRYFFAPSALSLKKGEGYYQNSYILLNSANYGVTESFTMGGGVVLPVLFYITPKISFHPATGLYLATGLFFSTSFIGEVEVGLGIVYGVMTLGNSENNFSLACGYGFSRLDSDWRTMEYPIVVLSGVRRLSGKIALVSENWAVASKYLEEHFEQVYDPEIGVDVRTPVMVWDGTYKYNGILSAGIRWLGEKVTFDLAFLVPINVMDDFIVLPYLDLVMRF